MSNLSRHFGGILAILLTVVGLVGCGGSSTGGFTPLGGGSAFGQPSNPNTAVVSTAVVVIERPGLTSREARVRVDPIPGELRTLKVRVMFPNGEVQESQLLPGGGLVLTPFYTVDNGLITVIFGDEADNQVSPPADLSLTNITDPANTGSKEVQVFGPPS